MLQHWSNLPSNSDRQTVTSCSVWSCECAETVTWSLDGGADGLDAYREISELLRELLSPSGKVVFEIGAQQGDAVIAIFCAAGFVGIKNCKDLAGRDRALIFSKA